MLFEILIIIGLILLNGVFSMSEIALVSSKKSRLDMIAKKGNKGAVAAGELLVEPTRFLSTVQIGITLIGILTGLFSGATISATLATSIATVPVLAPYASTIAITLVVLIVTYLTLVFGELIPKRLGMGSPEKIASFIAIPMSFVSMVSKPFVSLLSSSTHIIFRILNIKDDDNKVTEEEILALIDEGISTGAVDEIEQDLMENIFYLGDKRLEALMTHISDVISVPSTASKEEVINTFREHRYSVYPVYEGHQENVIGIISIKDVFIYPENEEFSIVKILKPIHFFPEYTKSFKVLEHFMESKTHHSILVDEFGSMLGLITMNDLLNDIVGNLSEEESISYEFTKRDETSWFADGMYPFVDFLKQFDIDDEPFRTSHFHTLAGFVIYKLKKMPTEGDVLIWRKFKFEVVDMDNRRIDKLLVTELDDEPK
jgi:putative hemolysin